MNGQYIDRVFGYRMIRMPEHPFAVQNGYIREHRLVMERVLGRHLAPTEHVHHLNHDRLDNRPENLMLVTQAEHNRIHKTSPHQRRFTCEVCQKQFTKKPSHPTPARFCSWACRTSIRPSFQCETCGNTFTVKPIEARRSRPRHCSWACRITQSASGKRSTRS